MPFNSAAFGPLELELAQQTAETDVGTFMLSSLPLFRLADAPAVTGASAESRASIVAAVVAELMNSMALGLVESFNGKVVDRRPIQIDTVQGLSISGPVLDEAGNTSGKAFLAHVVVSEALTLYVALAVTRDDELGRERAAAFVHSFALSSEAENVPTSSGPGR